jgi:hypothetical protein
MASGEGAHPARSPRTSTPEVFFMRSIAFLSPQTALLVALGASLAGCGGENVDAAAQQLAADGTAAVAAFDSGTIGLSAGAFEVASSADPVAVTSAFVAAPADPGDANCRTGQVDPNDPSTVIVTLRDCTGLFGRRVVSGTEIIHFSAGANGVLRADLHSQELTVDGQPASHLASADITFDGAARHVAWQGSWQGVNDRGEAVSHTSDLILDVDTTAHCRTRNGTAVTMVSARQVDSTIKGVEVCRDADGDPGCPTGSVVHTRVATGKQLTVAFNGSAEAQVTTPRGVSFELPLTCQE